MQTPPAALPAPPELEVGSTGSWLALGGCLGFGLMVSVATDAPPGLAVTLAIWAAAAVIALTGRWSAHGAVLLAAAVVIGGLTSIRASNPLLVLDIVAATSLLAAAASLARDGRRGRTTTRSYAVRSWLVPFEMLPAAGAELAAPPRSLTSSGPGVRQTVRAAVLVGPVVVILIALLARADRAFANLVSLPALDPGSIVTDVIVISLGAIALACLVAATHHPSALTAQADEPASLPWVRPAERIALLVAVDVVFAIFVAVQFAVFFGGQARVTEVDGLTYAEYARSGFWQLLGAAAIAGGVLAFAWLGGQRVAAGRDRTGSAVLSIVLVSLVLVVLVSAFQRLRLYEQAYGYTPLRILVHVAIVGVGVLLVCAAIGIGSGRAAWLPTAAVAIGVGAVIALSAVDMDGFIARANLERAGRGASLDVTALANLSADAVPPAVKALATLPEQTQREVRTWLACEKRDLFADESWAGANIARERAKAALAPLDLPQCPAW